MTRTRNTLISSSKLARNTRMKKIYSDKILVQDICNKKHNYYKTRSVTNAIAIANSNAIDIAIANVNPNPNANVNPTVIKNHKYIPNLKNSISNIRKTINIKNLKIEIPINTY
jgi:hypothetical protein